MAKEKVSDFRVAKVRDGKGVPYPRTFAFKRTATGETYVLAMSQTKVPPFHEFIEVVW